MACLDEFEYETLLKGVSFKEARRFIEQNSEEVYYVEPGYKIFGKCYLIGSPPIPLGVNGDDLLIPLVKPRFGTLVIKISSEDETRRLMKRDGYHAENRIIDPNMA